MLFRDIYRVETSVLLKFYGPVMCGNRPGIVPMLATSFQLPDYDPIVSH